MKFPPIRIVVVGAGAAGIKLAHTLVEESSSLSRRLEIVVLEANDYAGGRVRCRSFAGHTVEMGANWISGRETAFDNPVWALAKKARLRGHPSRRDDPRRVHAVEVGRSSGDGVVTERYLEQAERFEGIYAKALAGMAERESHRGRAAEEGPGTDSDGRDASVRSLLERYGWTPKGRLSNIERAVEHNVLEVWVADKLEELSGLHDMKPGANDVDLGQDEMFVEDPRGFNSIFQGLLADLSRPSSGDGREGVAATVLLGRRVESIHYGPGDVKVVATAAGKRSPNGGDAGEVAIEEVYHADIVVSTVSLGVLQSGSIAFVPPLPGWKVAALNQVGMFTFAKVYASFDKRLWPEDKDYLLFISDGEEKRGHYPLWMPYKNAATMGKNLLMCYLGGSQAERVESLSEEELKDEVEELFSGAFPMHRREECRPTSAAATDWSRNPCFRGSYSYFPLGAFRSVPESDYRCGLTGAGVRRRPLRERLGRGRSG